MRGMKEREYKITRCDLWYNIYKKLEDWALWYLSSWKKRTLNKDHAKVYFHRDEAVSDLVIIKVKDAKSD